MRLADLRFAVKGNSLKIFQRILFLVLAAAAVFLFSPEARAEKMKNVLILNSYHQGFKWTDDITQGIISALEPVKDSTRIYIEYMGTKWVRDEQYFHELRGILKHKFSRARFDLIICSDDDAFDFLCAYRDEVFGRIPVVFCGVNYFTDAGLKGKSLYTGISETADLKESLDIALRLHPKTKRIFVINDSGISGKKVEREIASLIPLYRGRVQFEFERETSLGNILRDVEALSPDTLIFFTFFYGTVTKQFYEYDEGISLISRHAWVPVYGAWDFNLGHGMVGGKLTSGFDQGIDAGQMGLRILKGESVRHIPIIHRSRTRFMFDHRQMARFGIKTSALPKGSIVINEPVPFRRVRNELVWGALSGLAGLSTLVIMLLLIISHRKRSEEFLRKARDELEMTVEERTRELSKLNEKLCDDIKARERAEEDLRRANRELIKEVEARKYAEDASKQSVSLLRATIESTNDGILVVDKCGMVVDWNKRFLEMWSIPDQLILLRNDDHLLAFVQNQLVNSDEFVAKVRILYNQPEEESLDMLRFKDGRIFERYSRPQYIFNQIVGRVWSFRDITERKRMEEDILKSQKLESLGVLAGGIAHDFNNLLTGIMGNISLSKMYMDHSSKAFARLEEAEKACTLTRDLTSQLLTFAKGGAPIKKLDSMTRIIMDNAGFVLRGSNVRCEFLLPEDLWTVEVDAGQMSQVINNLIINADHAMPDGGTITVQAENVMLDAEDPLPLSEGRYVHILVRDQGVGIPAENLPKIFDPYFTTKKKGSGLGLASVYSIIMRHDGYVGVESKQGMETTFHLYLPASGKCIVKETSLPELRQAGKVKGRILVMDDEKVVRQTVCEILGHLGYGVDVCEDGTAALNLYREARGSGMPYALVIMDLTIPGGMGGKILMKKLLEIDSDARGIVTSGYSNDPIIAHHREYGFSGVITKPFKVDEMAEIIRTLV
jgi:PAS domain S-box-containing protein